MLETHGNVFAGERLDSKSHLSRNLVTESMARYRLITDVPGVVLDAGCGTGYGCHMLARNGHQVYGMDISREAICYAKKNWNSYNVSYLVASGTDIPFPDNTFDTVVSYEVLEHICRWVKFLYELRRITKPRGKIYLSTPNREVYSPNGTINPYHYFEMNLDEFREALGDFFRIERVLGQRTPTYNDHWIWKVVNPLFSALKLNRKTRNTLNLHIINWIKPNLTMNDVVFSDKEEEIRKSWFMVAIATPRK